MGKKKHQRGIPTDFLNVMGNLAEFDEDMLRLLDEGQRGRVQILEGTERPNEDREPYARTYVDIEFDNEKDLRECVKLLRWSDERLRARPELLIAWSWNKTFRDKMTISFGVDWYDQDFYNSRKGAFQDKEHAKYYAMFGATVETLQMRHEVLGDSPPAAF